MADEKDTWKRFRRLSFDSKAVSKRARQAETKTTKHAHKFVVNKLSSLRNAKRHIISWLAIVGILIAAVAVQTLWYQKSYKTTAWSDTGTYAEGVMGPINTLNPLYAATDAELSASKLLFSSLYRYDSTNRLGDDLAIDTKVSKDERTYTIKIRDDVRWSDESKLTANDIVFTVELMKSPEVRSIMYGSWNDITATALDDYTVQFQLPSRYAAFSHALTFAILPKHVLDTVNPASLRQHSYSVSPVSSGPFKIRLLQLASDGKHKIANLLANENYYRGKPQLSRFAIHAYDTQQTLDEGIKSGEVNAAIGVHIPPEDLPKTHSKLYLPSYSGVYAVLNTASGPLKNIKIRKALQTGTNTEAIRSSVGYPVPKLWLPFVSTQLYGKDVPKAPTFNKKQANNLLSAAGWKYDKALGYRINNNKQPLTLRIVTVRNHEYESVIQELSKQWKELGVDVQTDEQDPNSPGQNFVQNVLQPRDYDVLLYKLVIGADPDVYAYWHSSQVSRLGYNFSNYRSDIADDALTSARSRNITALRNEKYKDFAKRWLSDAPAIGLYQPVEEYVYGSSVRPLINATGIPTPADRYSQILYWSAKQDEVYKTP